MGYNYIEYYLDSYIDSLYDHIDKKNINDILNNIISDKWKHIYEDIIIFYISCMTSTDNNILIELGYPYLIKYINKLNDKKIDKKEEYHMYIKQFIFDSLVQDFMDSMIEKYIDTFFNKISILITDYKIKDIKQNDLIYYKLFNIIENKYDNIKMLKQLTLTKNIRIISMYIQLINSITNNSVVHNILNTKKNKILEIYKKYNNIKSYNILSKLWNVNSHFYCNFNFQNLINYKLQIPFYPINEQIQFDEYLTIFINNKYELYLNYSSIDYILYKTPENNVKLINESEIADVYDTYIKSYYISLLERNTIKNLSDLKEINTYYNGGLYKYIIEKYFTKYIHVKKNDVIKNIINNLMKTNIYFEFENVSQVYECIHDTLLLKLNNVKSINEYKSVSKILSKIINTSICTICGTIIKNDFIDEDVVMIDNIENMDQYFKLSDFIKNTRLIITKISRIFYIPLFTSTDNLDHKNFIIQNLISIITNIKENESYCKNIISINDSLFFIFAITNNIYLQEYDIDKYIYRKWLNIYIIIIILLISYYNIQIRYEFTMFKDLFISSYKTMLLNTGLKYNESVYYLFVYITVFILKYRLYYDPNENIKIKLSKRITKYGPFIFSCLMDYITILNKLNNKGILNKQYGKLSNILTSYRGSLDSYYISMNYTRILLDWDNYIIRKKIHKLNKINRLINDINLNLGLKKYGCKIFCKDGKDHTLQKNFICSKCNQDILLCKYDIDTKKINYKHIQNIEKNKILIQNNIYEFNFKFDDNYKNILNQIYINLNEGNNELYNRVYLRRDILKINIENLNIILKTSSTPINLYYIDKRLMNMEFAETKVNINYNKLGILYFDRYKSIVEFNLDIEYIAINSVCKNISIGKRSYTSNLISKIYQCIDKCKLIKNINFDYTNIILVENKSNNIKCILENDYKSFTVILMYYISILSIDLTYLNAFYSNLNNYINNLKTESPFFKYNK
jgi:hypothetical protein